MVLQLAEPQVLFVLFITRVVTEETTLLYLPFFATERMFHKSNSYKLVNDYLNLSLSTKFNPNVIFVPNFRYFASLQRQQKESLTKPTNNTYV